MPRVLLVTQDLERAGAQRQCVELALGLRGQGRDWEVEVAVLEPGGPLTAELTAAGIAVIPVPRRWRWDLAPIRGLARLVREHRADVLHTFMFLPNFYGRVTRLMAPPVVVISSVRSGRIDGWHRYLAEGALAFLCDAIIANSDAGRGALRRLGVADSRIHVVRNGIDLDRFRPRPAMNPSLDRDRPVRIGMVARMESSRAHPVLIRAMRTVGGRYPKARLILAGDGRRRRSLEDLARALGIGDRVDFPGPVARPETVYAGLDLYVQASAVREGTSNSLLEAMACGLPVIATGIGGNLEVVVEGETGLLVPPDDPDRLAAAILTLLEDPGRAARMGLAGSRRARDLYSRAALVSATTAVYERLLARRRTGER